MHSAEQERIELRDNFIDISEWAGSLLVPVRQDVSIRKFYRLVKDDKSAILMDAPAPLEDTHIFEIVHDKFAKIGLRVPEIYIADHESGFVIMEDFGDNSCYEILSEGRDNLENIYKNLVDVLVHKYIESTSDIVKDCILYSDDYWLKRVEEFLTYYVPYVLSIEIDDKQRAEFMNIFRDMIKNTHKLPSILLHGDYGVQNLYYFSDKEGIDKIGIIDFQDKTDGRDNVMGSPAFDPAFLLNDVRADISDKLEQEMKQYFIDKAGIVDVETFNQEYSIIVALQAVKCLGMFARLVYRDERDEYIPFISNCLRNLKKNLDNPCLQDLVKWFKNNNINI